MAAAADRIAEASGAGAGRAAALLADTVRAGKDSVRGRHARLRPRR